MPRPRSSKSLIPPWLDTVPQPAILFHGDGSIAVINAAGNRWLGLDGEVWRGHKPHPGNIHSVDPVERRLAGLAFDPADSGFSPRQTVFAVGTDGLPDIREATVTRLCQDNGSPAWILLVVDLQNGSGRQHSAAPAPGDISRMRAAVASQLLEFRKQQPLYPLIGRSPSAELLRAQITAAESATSHLLIGGPAGSGREQLAQRIHAQRYAASANPPPLLTVQSRLADPGFIADLLSQSSMDRRSFDPPVTCLLLVGVTGLEPAAQTELAGFLRGHPGQICLFATIDEGGAVGGKTRENPRTDAFLPDPFLFGQLAAQRIAVPPLRQRRADIPAIATAIVDAGCRAARRPPVRIGPAAMETLVEYAWPGEMTELASVLGEALVACTAGQMETSDLPPAVRMSVAAQRGSRLPVETVVLDELLQGIEREVISRALSQAKFNRSLAARLLGITRSRLLRRCEQLHLALPTEMPDLEPIDFEEAAE